MNGICLVIDRLHLGNLGCYGNSWINTPHFNRLAADGFVFDQALIDSPELGAHYESLFSGTHALARVTARAESPPNIVARLAAAEVHTALITDDPAAAGLLPAQQLDEIVRLESRVAEAPAEEIAQTNLARYFAVAAQWLQSAPEPFCLWLHCGALGTAWDAPLALRDKYADEEEPPPFAETVPPCRWLAPHYDPDELLAVAQAYAGEVSLLDICLGAMIEGLDRLPLSRRTLLSVSSARGYPLGEHRRIGPVDESLYAETVHAAWILRLPDGCGAAARSQALVDPSDLAPTLSEWFALPANDEIVDGRSLLPLVREEVEMLRDRAFVVGARGARAVRTPAWHLYEPAAAAGGGAPQSRPPVELFAKPDDRWDLNDVADRCPHIVELLASVLAAGLLSRAGVAAAPLAEILLSGPD